MLELKYSRVYENMNLDYFDGEVEKNFHKVEIIWDQG
jgi:hypothetical protein